MKISRCIDTFGWRAVAVFLLLGHAAPAAAQSTAVVSGTVRAQDGLPLPGVSVRSTPGDARAATDARGRFRVSIPAGAAVTLSFAREGFHEATVPVGSLAAGASREVGVVLTALFALDAVSVVAERERPLLNTEDAATGGAVARLELAGLPTDARNPLTLAFTVPGVSQSTGFFGDAPPLSIHGSNSLYTQFLVDGLDNNEGFLGGPRVEMPLAAISRFSVLASTYGAGLGRSSNGVVNLETRAGGERWGGEWFVFGRPGIPFDASPHLAPAGTDPEGFRRVQAGGAVGGPVVAGRTFAFATAEFSDEREDRIGSTAQTEFLGTELRDTRRASPGWTTAGARPRPPPCAVAASDVERVGQGGGVIVPEADITTVRRGTITALTHRSAPAGGTPATTVSRAVRDLPLGLSPDGERPAHPAGHHRGPDLTTVEAVVGSSNFIFDERERQLQLRNVFEVRLGRHTLRAGADLSALRLPLLGSNTNPRAPTPW
jgi:hypothetical protein